MLRRCFLTGTAVLVAWAALSGVAGKANPDPVGFIDNLDRRLQAAVSDTAPEQRLARFRQLLREDFDVPGIARFVLGRYWLLATPAQQQEFVSLLEDYIVRTYSDRLSKYADSGDALRITGSRPGTDGMVVVSSQINLANGGGPRAGGHGPTVPPIKFDWLLVMQNGSYKISDVIVDGISMAVTQRSEFASEIQRNGGQVQTLLATMRERAISGARG